MASSKLARWLPTGSAPLAAVLIGSGLALVAHVLGVDFGSDALNNAVIPAVGLLLGAVVNKKQTSTSPDTTPTLASVIAAEVEKAIAADPSVAARITTEALRLLAAPAPQNSASPAPAVPAA